MSDTLSTLRAIVTPTTGMRRIPLPTESYEHSSIPLSAKKLLNFYVEQEPSDARSDVALMPTPGLLPFLSVGAGPVQALNDDQPGRIYAVSGDHFYRLTFSGGPVVTEDLGAIGVPVDIAGGVANFVTIAVGVEGAVVCVPPNAFTCTHTGALNQIGGTFPDTGASSVCYLDGYFVFSAYGNTAQVFISHLLDPTNFDALDFVFADAVPSVVRRVITHRGEVWMLGDAGFEIWYDAGDADFPFRRQSGGVIPYGTHSTFAVARADNSVWWVGNDNNVYRSQGYIAQRVSTHAIETIIAGFGGVADAGLTYTQFGHTFYCVTMGNRTLCYDIATKKWHERSSAADGNSCWLPRSVASAGATAFFGDSLSGALYTMEIGLGTDNGVNVARAVVLPPQYAANVGRGAQRVYCARLEIEMEVGSADGQPGPVNLAWSDDGGFNFTGLRLLSAGTAGQKRKRVYTTRLGSFRERVFSITVFASATIYAVDADLAAV